MNEKSISFPDILDNEGGTYNEWRQNDHKCLALCTKEWEVGELKEKLVETFSIFQKHFRAKRVMHATFEKDKLYPNHMLLQIDLAMLYSCEYQNEIPSALWSCRSVNLFKAATYNAEGKEGFFFMVINLFLYFHT